MTGSDEKRRHDRFAAEDVRGSFAYAVQAQVLNISLGGLAVRTQTQLAIGRKYRFQLGDKRDAVQLSGSVRWCRLSGTERQETGDIVAVYEAGISFDDVLTGTAGDLLQFMEKNIIIDLKQRISGRFRVEKGGAVELESDSGFDVRQISLSGMMIESGVEVEPGTRLDLEIELGQNRLVVPVRIIYRSEAEPEAVGDEAEAEDAARRYRMGVEFLEISEARRAVLERFIRTELSNEE